ncbi:MAG: hypothetical protein JNN08_01895 [Bryobacterales bacterium]|nr:hypothetical protein [Bryobacterales bacterium]
MLPAQASVLQDFNDRATFVGAANSLVNIDFEGTATTPYVNGAHTTYWSNYSTSGGLNIDGISFVGVMNVGNWLYATNASDPNASENYGTGTVLKGPEWNTGSYVSITLPANVTAFGFDIGAMLPSTATFRIELTSLGVSYDVTTAPRPTLTYWGVTTDSAIGEIRVTTIGGSPTQTQLLIDNAVYGLAGGGVGGLEQGPTGETPEVTTILYVASGLGLLYWNKRRRIQPVV